MKCLCCDKEIINGSVMEQQCRWHKKCLKSFFGTETMPTIDISESSLEKQTQQKIEQGVTVTGVQKKMSLHLEKTKEDSRLTLIDCPSSYILKPQSSEYSQLPEVEYLVMEMAKKTGIQVAEHALIEINKEYAYITKRIDRVKKSRNYYKLAMEDFCQLSNRLTEDKYKSSYERCGKIIQDYTNYPGIEITEFLFRLIFCYTVGNSDMHLKNFSLIETAYKSKEYQLSKAYDLLAVNLVLPEDLDQMALTLDGKKRNLTKNSFYHLAEKLNVGKKVMDGLIQKVLKMKEEYLKMVDESYLSNQYKEDFKKLILERLAIFE